MGNFVSTAEKIGTGFLGAALVGLVLVAIAGFLGDRSTSAGGCATGSAEEGAVATSALGEVEGFKTEDSILISLGFANRPGTGLAGFELPEGANVASNGHIRAEAGLFSHSRDRSLRIPPSAFKTTVEHVNSVAVVELCVDVVDLRPGVYKGSVVIADSVVMDAEVQYTGWSILLGLPLALLPALLALSAVGMGDDHLALHLIVALAGATFAWAAFSSGLVINSAGDFGRMLAEEFAGASGFLVALKALTATSSNASQDNLPTGAAGSPDG